MTSTSFSALSGRQSGWRVPAAVFLGAFLLRFAAGAAVPSLRPHSNDSEAYRDLARNLVRRHIYATVVDPPHSLDVPYVTRPPLVPLSLALVYTLLGMNRISELLLLATVGSLACVAIYCLGLELFDPGVALAAALFGALYPFFLVLSAVPLTESWNVLLYPLLALALVRYIRRRQLRDAWFAGAILGLSALCKPVVLTLYPFLFLVPVLGQARNDWRLLARGFVVTGLIAVLVIAPWTARNYRKTGHLIPVSLQFGAALFLGTSPAAEYSIGRLERGLTNGWDNPPNFARLYPQGTDPIAVDREAARRATAYIRHDPAAFSRLAWRKLRVFWGSYPHPAARISWVVLAALAACGIFLTRTRWRELIPLYLLIANTMLVPILFTSMPRFRAPIEPLLMLFAGRTLVWIAERVSAGAHWPDRVIERGTPPAPV